MKLWHRTDQAGRDGIVADGFKIPDDGPPPGSPEHGLIWFAGSPTVARQRTLRSGWWIVVEAPDDTPEYDLGDDLAGHGLYALPVDVANGLPRAIQAGN